MDSLAEISDEPDGEPRPALRVLVTDDEPLLRSIILEFLETLGFDQFYEAANGVEALDRIRAAPIDCMLSDMRMPRMDLEELLRVIAAEFPDLMVIATSGFSDLESASFILERGAHEFLAKPLNLDHLERALTWIPARRELLASAGALFGEAGAAMAISWDERIEILERALTERGGDFGAIMSHARRVAAVARILGRDLVESERRELELAALLHEIGVCGQHLLTIGEPRKLRPAELNLVRLQASLAARLIRRALPGRPAARIIERHQAWNDPGKPADDGGAMADRLACLLGVANLIDGVMTDRPDRPAMSAAAALTLVQQLRAERDCPALKPAVDRWPEIEALLAAWTGD